LACVADRGTTEAHRSAASVGGASDGNFAAAAGAQVLDGLGAIGDGAHAAHEWVDISTLEIRSTLLNALIKDLLND
jgi:glutamate carboxypeptidase